MEALILLLELIAIVLLLRGISAAEATGDPDSSLGIFAYKTDATEKTDEKRVQR
jgi:hypothetical protein